MARPSHNVALLSSIPLAVLLAGPLTHASDSEVSFHDITAMEWIKMSALPGVREKTVVGNTASFIMVGFDAGAATRRHHHTFETMTYGVEGAVTMEVGGVSASLAPDRAAIAPPDVEHVDQNNGTASAVMLELCPVQRFDLIPPFTRQSFAAAPEAKSLPEGRTISADFRDDSPAWSRVGGHKEASLTGEHVALRVLLIAPGASNIIELRPQPTGSEQLSFLVRGTGELAVNKHTTAMTEGTLVILPPDSSRVTFRNTGATPARIVDYHPIEPARLPTIR